MWEVFCLAACWLCRVPSFSHVHCVVEPLLFRDCTSVLPSATSSRHAVTACHMCCTARIPLDARAGVDA